MSDAQPPKPPLVLPAAADNPHGIDDPQNPLAAFSYLLATIPRESGAVALAATHNHGHRLGSIMIKLVTPYIDACMKAIGRHAYMQRSLDKTDFDCVPYIVRHNGEDYQMLLWAPENHPFMTAEPKIIDLGQGTRFTHINPMLAGKTIPFWLAAGQQTEAKHTDPIFLTRNSRMGLHMAKELIEGCLEFYMHVYRAPPLPEKPARPHLPNTPPKDPAP